MRRNEIFSISIICISVQHMYTHTSYIYFFFQQFFLSYFVNFFLLFGLTKCTCVLCSSRDDDERKKKMKWEKKKKKSNYVLSLHIFLLFPFIYALCLFSVRSIKDKKQNFYNIFSRITFLFCWWKCAFIYLSPHIHNFSMSICISY